MAARIYVVRHAQALYNVDEVYSRPDPELTQLGHQQAENLCQTFQFFDSVGLIVASPLRRTIQTTLLAFPKVLNKSYYEEGSGKGVQNGVKLVLNPDLQEAGAMPCDTGSDRRALETAFPHLDFSTLYSTWPLKEGVYSADDRTVKERARNVRGYLRERIATLKESKRKDIIVVMHGMFTKFLVDDPTIDLPKAGWKSYWIVEDKDKEDVLVPVDECL